MKNMKRQFMLFACALSAFFVLTSCQQEEVLEASNGTADLSAVNSIDPDEGETAHDHGIMDKDEIMRHVDGHGVYTDMVEEVINEYPDGTTEKTFLVDGCINMTRAQLTAELDGDTDGRQYHTNNLVSDNNISVIGYTGGSYALTSKMRTALSWAINNYNRLSINKTFTLSFAASTNADIVVYRNYTNGGAGGSAGFPSGGAPYKWVQIYAGMENYNTNVNEHVMTHEIGHCMGLRHTDYFNRASCGQNSNEGSAGVGAVHVPGTPTGIDWNSVMLACFSSNEDGEFGFYDRVALEYLY